MPIYLEILDGSRIGRDFVRTDFFNPFRYLVYYLSDIYGSSIYKMQYLGQANTNLGSKINPNNVVECIWTWCVCLFGDNINYIFNFSYILCKKILFMEIYKAFFICFLIFFLFFQIFQIFLLSFPSWFMNYISGFFLAISASIGLDYLIKK